MRKIQIQLSGRACELVQLIDGHSLDLCLDRTGNAPTIQRIGTNFCGWRIAEKHACSKGSRLSNDAMSDDFPNKQVNTGFCQRRRVASCLGLTVDVDTDLLEPVSSFCTQHFMRPFGFTPVLYATCWLVQPIWSALVAAGFITTSKTLPGRLR